MLWGWEGKIRPKKLVRECGEGKKVSAAHFCASLPLELKGTKKREEKTETALKTWWAHAGKVFIKSRPCIARNFQVGYAMHVCSIWSAPHESI